MLRALGRGISHIRNMRE
jgi:hypothetical protein